MSDGFKITIATSVGSVNTANGNFIGGCLKTGSAQNLVCLRMDMLDEYFQAPGVTTEMVQPAQMHNDTLPSRARLPDMTWDRSVARMCFRSK